MAAGLCIDIHRIPAGSQGGLLPSVGACLSSLRNSMEAEEEGVGLRLQVYTQVLLFRSDGSFICSSGF